MNDMGGFDVRRLVAALMEKYRLTQKDLAPKLGMRPAKLSYILSHVPDNKAELYTIWTVTEVFGIPFEEVIRMGGMQEEAIKAWIEGRKTPVKEISISDVKPIRPVNGKDNTIYRPAVKETKAPLKLAFAR